MGQVHYGSCEIGILRVYVPLSMDFYKKKSAGLKILVFDVERLGYITSWIVMTNLLSEAK